MATEIEKKYRLTAEQREHLKTALEKSGAIFSGTDFEVNELYRGGILNDKNAVLRLRKIGPKTILTYKERLADKSATKHQIEYETEVSEAGEIEKIIESLGFEKTALYEKSRETWHLNAAEIVLDELPFGLFMEIEGSVAEIAKTEKLLGAEDFEAEHETYPRLTAQLGKLNGKTIEARFEKNLETLQAFVIISFC